MKKYDYYYKTNKSYTKYALVGFTIIFCLTITTFALLEVHSFYSDEPAVIRILMNSFKSSKGEDSPDNVNNKFVLVNLEEQANKEELLKHIITQEQENGERQVRAATNENATNSTPQKTNSYYEEQKPVVVYSKTDVSPSIAYRQMAEVPPKQDNDNEDPYSKPLADEDYGSDDYFGQPEQRTQQEPQPYYRQQSEQPTYYRPQQQQQQQPPQPYYRQSPPPPQPYYRQQPPQASYYQSPPHSPYYNGPDNDQEDSEEARSSQYRDYPNYYRQYPYATPPPMAANNKRLSEEDNQGNRKMSIGLSAKTQLQNRDPYPAYMDDYDYMSPQSHAPQQPPQYPYAKRPVSPQIPQYRTPSTAAPAQEKQETGQQMDYLSMLKSLKTMWDLYQSFTSSWNTIAEKRTREEQLAQEKYKQMQQIRINSKKPPKFNNKKNATQPSKNPRKQTTTTTARTILNSSEMYTSSEEEVQQVKKQPMAKVEPRRGMKGEKAASKNEDNLRDKRQADSTDVGEGRYIKGDPLKGYYDFVITEGSYKFWAAFQVGTAILIIYSTFAAIYYSKVNPLVSDYDYTDYLGGARSLSGGDLDFVDDDGVEQKAQPKSWLEYLPRTGHSLKFILDAIDKLPTDHVGDEGRNEEEQAEEGSSEQKESPYETEYTDEGGQTDEIENADETEASSETKQDNNAM